MSVCLSIFFSFSSSLSLTHTYTFSHSLFLIRSYILTLNFVVSYSGSNILNILHIVIFKSFLRIKKKEQLLFSEKIPRSRFTLSLTKTLIQKILSLSAPVHISNYYVFSLSKRRTICVFCTHDFFICLMSSYFLGSKNLNATFIFNTFVSFR